MDGRGHGVNRLSRYQVLGVLGLVMNAPIALDNGKADQVHTLVF